MGVPVAGGFYKRGLIADSRNIRSRCSAWIQQDGFSLVIDVGPEFRLQSIFAGITQIDAVLITHEHMDHVAGIDDLRMYNYNASAPLSPSNLSANGKKMISVAPAKMRCNII